MTKGTTRKGTTGTAAKKTAAKKTAAAKTPKAPEPMDDSVEEVAIVDGDTSAHAPMRERLARSLGQLVTEVTHLFPEVTWQIITTTSRGVVVSIMFEHWDENTEPSFSQVLDLVRSDARVSDVEFSGDGADERWAHVGVYPSLRTMDNTDSFGLEEAYLILAKRDGEGDDE